MKKTRWTHLLSLSSVLLTVSAIAQNASAFQNTPDAVWIWSKQCDGQRKFGIKVRLEGKVLYQATLPICHGNREAEDGRLEFHFSNGHLFDGRFRARKSQRVEGDIWQAGGEPDALILGISFATKNQILLNTLHIAKPDKQTSAKLDKRLLITTYPVIDR